MVAPRFVRRSLAAARVDLSARHPTPSPGRLVAAVILAVGGSLLADALLVSVGTAIFPSTRGYGHFQFDDYAKLTIIGVAIACAAWPVVARISSAPKWLFFRLAVVVTLVLWLPDLYILVKGQPPKAVAVLACMHLAIAGVTYNALARLAPATNGPRGEAQPDPDQALDRRRKVLWTTRSQPRRINRRLTFRGLALVVAAFLGMTVVLFVLPATDLPQHVDAIVSFNGPNEQAREQLAVSLAEKGYSRLLLFSRGGSTSVSSCPRVPRVRVVCFVDASNDTRGEARFAARYARQHHLKSLMIVPGRPQTTRAHLLLERCFPGRIVVVPASEPLPRFPADVIHEWGGLIDALVFRRGC